MATLGTQALTLSDLRKRLAPDGSVDFIIEALLNANPIMDDITWKMGNLPTGNRTTIRTSMPKPSVRRINRGVTRHKSTTKQVQDTCIILEDRSCVDVEEIALAPNGEQFRRSEDAAFVGGFSDAIAANIFYGNADDDLDTFNRRYLTLTARSIRHLRRSLRGRRGSRLGISARMPLCATSTWIRSRALWQARTS